MDNRQRPAMSKVVALSHRRRSGCSPHVMVMAVAVAVMIGPIGHPSSKSRTLQGFGFVEFREASCAAAARAAMDGAVPPVPATPLTSPAPREQRHGRLFEMGFDAQVCCVMQSKLSGF